VRRIRVKKQRAEVCCVGAKGNVRKTWSVAAKHGQRNRLILVNKAFAEMHGYWPSELVGKHVSGHFGVTHKRLRVNPGFQIF